MYTLSKESTKFLDKTWYRGLQTLEKIERRDPEIRNKDPFDSLEMNSVQKYRFNNSSRNKMNNAVNPNHNTSNSSIRLSPTPTESQPSNHEEIVRFIAQTWFKVLHEYETSSQRPSRDGNVEGPVYYQEKVAAPLSNFQPFDLELWASKRAVEKLNDTSS